MRKFGASHMDTDAWFTSGSCRGAVLPPLAALMRDDQVRVRDRRPLRVWNARLLDPPASLEVQGFELVACEPPCARIADFEALDAEFRASNQEIVTRLTGSRDTQVAQRQYRNGFGGLRPDHPLAERPLPDGSPAHYGVRIHCDVSPWVETEPEWRGLSRGRHCAMYNVWRSIDAEREVARMPLAVADVRNIAERDMIATVDYDILPDNRPFVTWVLAHNALQAWFYYPGMRADEALVFKLYDTREEKSGRRGVFHAAVHDPGTPADAPPRRSMDMRVVARFDEDRDVEARRARFLAGLPPIPAGAASRPSASTRTPPAAGEARS